MSGLRPPPKDSPGRAVGRIIFLIVLLTVLAVIVWAAVVNQNIGLVENESLEDIDIANGQTVGDLTINVNESGNSPVPVVLLHDSDITGSPIFARLVATLGEDVRVILVDLPGFGLSSRIPGEAPGHTVSSMAGAISEVIATRTEGPAVLVGVGLGGEVAAEIAVNHPEQVASLVMIDSDFYADKSWTQVLEGIPWFGSAVTYAFEASGSFSNSEWAPYCESGGWCPSEPMVIARSVATSISQTTESLNGFVNTPPASDVPLSSRSCSCCRTRRPRMA